jgi:hypothetical protein
MNNHRRLLIVCSAFAGSDVAGKPLKPGRCMGVGIVALGIKVQFDDSCTHPPPWFQWFARS